MRGKSADVACTMACDSARRPSVIAGCVMRGRMVLRSGPMSLSTRSPRSSVPQTGALDDLEASLVATIPPVMRHLLAHARKRRAWAELTYSQYNVLRIIDQDGPTAQA